MDLNTIKDNYTQSQTKIAKMKKREVELLAKAERLKKRRYKLESNNHWTEQLIRPVMELIKPYFPTLSWNDERLTPMGLRCAVTVFGSDINTNETITSLTFTIDSLEKGDLCYDFKKGAEYPKGSIGYLNGFNNESKIIESIDELINYIEQQCKKNLVD